MQHAHLLEHLDDDFETIFGREFLRAYEAQSGSTPTPTPTPTAGGSMAEPALTVSLAALSQTGQRECNEDAFGYWQGAERRRRRPVRRRRWAWRRPGGIAHGR